MKYRKIRTIMNSMKMIRNIMIIKCKMGSMVIIDTRKITETI